MIEGALLERLRSIAREQISARGFELVHVETAGPRRNPVIRIYIDKPGGITLDDCSDVSRDIEACLDTDDLIPTSYVLEVSSPGIERGLYSAEDFKRFSGSDARIKTAEPVEGKSSFVGTILNVENGAVLVNDRLAGEVRIDLSNVKRANLKVDLSRDLR